MKRPIIYIPALSILIFALCFWLFYGTNDLFRFPFLSDVWGNASDWIMILVTFGTAVFLLLTFQEQQKTNRIQMLKYRKTIAPKFDVGKDLLTGEKTNLSAYDQSSRFLEITLLMNDANNITYKIHDGRITYNYHRAANMKVGDKIYFEYNSMIQSKEQNKEELIITIEYSDIEENIYDQQIILNNSEFAMKSAKLIKESPIY